MQFLYHVGTTKEITGASNLRHTYYKKVLDHLSDLGAFRNTRLADG